ncbi:alpha-amylase family glycosyl hydrolase [Undibacterium sp. Dicai25W]|uniref:alpha-amylase family glycosyl hydrolase n=1 Tax=Undibacterium sp. Dicai25W TaxID=3413034 RepID=UPI003BF03138
MKLTRLSLALVLLFVTAISPIAVAAENVQAKPQIKAIAPFIWENATVYFLLTDRFYNADSTSHLAYDRQQDAAPLRGFMGGNLAGITAKIKQGYFNKLGVNAIWITPPVEQIHGVTNEGAGNSYGFHGYWAADFTQVDANLGSAADMRELVDTAHAHGIRVLLDVVMNHVGRQTHIDALWPDTWVRTEPVCTYKDIPSTVSCALVKGLPDIRTESNEDVDLPPSLAVKWKAEGRYEKEMQELDAFFKRTGYPRAPRYYLMKWHADWVRKYGFDGFRADTVKHVEPEVWKEFKQVASAAFEDWKREHTTQKLGDEPFYMTAEVYGYSLDQGLDFVMDGGSKINFYDHGFDSLINFSFKNDAKKDPESLFSHYSDQLNGILRNHSILNYVSSHDDLQPFDLERQKALEAGTKLLLSPGAAQIYYGDETARDINVSIAEGDAKLRSMMNWDELENHTHRGGIVITEVLAHWRKLGMFRHDHVAVGAGVHQKLSDHPYTFKRTYQGHGLTDKVVVAMDMPTSQFNTISVQGVFKNGQKLRDYYSGNVATVIGGKVNFHSKSAMALIALEQ